MTKTKLSMFDRWRIWDRANPAFYEAWKMYADEAVAHGKTRLGSWLVANRIRWDLDVLTTGAGYKVPNGYIAYFARLWLAEHPHLPPLFATKTMKTAINKADFEQHLLDRNG